MRFVREQPTSKHLCEKCVWKSVIFILKADSDKTSHRGTFHLLILFDYLVRSHYDCLFGLFEAGRRLGIVLHEEASFLLFSV